MDDPDIELLRKAYRSPAATPSASDDADLALLRKAYVAPPPAKPAYVSPIPPKGVVPATDKPIYWPRSVTDLLNHYVTQPVKQAVETVAAPVVSMGVGALSNLAGVGKEIGRGELGQNTAQKYSDEYERQWQPQISPEAQANNEGISKMLSDLKLDTPLTNFATPILIGSAAKQLATAAPRAATIAADAEALANSRKAALKSTAQRKAVDMGLILDPSITNPTIKNKVAVSVAGGKDLRQAAEQANNARVNELVAKDIGLDPTRVLDGPAYKEAISNLSEPYRELAAIPSLDITPQEHLNIWRAGSSQEKDSPAVQAFIRANPNLDRLMSNLELQRGISGKDAVALMSDMRQEANRLADARMAMTPNQRASAQEIELRGAAHALEDAVTNSLRRTSDQLKSATPPPQWEEQWRTVGEQPKDADYYTGLAERFTEARPKLAQAYTYRRATNLNTGDVDALALAKEGEQSSHLSGTLKDIVDVTAHYPEVMGTPTNIARSAGDSALLMTSLSGLGGGLGTAAGLISAAGAPVIETANQALGHAGVTGLVGAGLGAAAGLVGAPTVSNWTKNLVLSPKYQAKNVRMPDVRALREQMGYAPAANITDFEPLGVHPNGIPLREGSGELPPTLTPYAPELPPLHAIPGGVQLEPFNLPAVAEPLPKVHFNEAPTLGAAPAKAAEHYPLITSQDLLTEVEQAAPGQAIQFPGTHAEKTPKLLPLPPTGEPTQYEWYGSDFPGGQDVQRLHLGTYSRASSGPHYMRLGLPPEDNLTMGSIDFPSRQEMHQWPEIKDATDNFRRQAQYYQDILDTRMMNEQQRAQVQGALNTLKAQFAAGENKLGSESDADIHGLLRPVFEAGNDRLQLPLENPQATPSVGPLSMPEINAP